VSKLCTRCGEAKPLSSFSKNSSRPDGYQGWCKECVVAYKSANDDRIKAQKQQYYSGNKAAILSQQQEYRRANTATVRAGILRRKARAANIPSNVSPDHITALIEMFNNACAYCGETLENGYHVDHFVPVSRGGHTVPGNLLVVCPACNMHKHSKLPQDWLPPEKYEQISRTLAAHLPAPEDGRAALSSNSNQPQQLSISL
jgi:5-methylcytosine-specific restriction endonuclease McrA